MKEYRSLMLLSVWLQCERIDARTVFANPIDTPAEQLHDALVAAADVKNICKTAVFLLQSDSRVTYPIPWAR